MGIILPGDTYTSVMIKTPGDIDYQLEYSGRSIILDYSRELHIKIEENRLNLRILDAVFKANQEIKLYPIKEPSAPAPGSGIIVRNVISGRDFHWQKNIDVRLPGTLILKRHGSHIIAINELPLEHYLMCVATSEMNASCPLELIKAQTIAARSWILANAEQKHRDLEMDVCNDDCCQRYQGTTNLSPHSIKGATETAGNVLMFENTICDARYSKNCGGIMESFDTIWPGKNPDYFHVKADADDKPMEWIPPLSEEKNFRRWLKATPLTFCSPWSVPEDELKHYLGNVDEQGRYFRWEIKVFQEEMTENMNKFHRIGAKAIVGVEVMNRGGSGRANRLLVEYIDQQDEHRILVLQSEYAIRQSLYQKFLYSSAITILPEIGKQDIPKHFIIKGAGWGHGVGLCQIGALGMALKGFEMEQILAHYYPGSFVDKIY
ncbi:MAG: SpoIID/LytB domain-containing protein [Calditrichaceae bacterium]